MKNCGHKDKNKKNIYYETSILLLPDGRYSILRFDVRQLMKHILI